MLTRAGFTFLVVIALCCSVLTAQQNWPEFRGNNGTGHARASLPADLEDTKNLAWKTKIHGKGWSSPVVWDQQVWLTTATTDGKKMSVLCLDLKTGKILLDRVIHENKKVDFSHPTNSYATPTPAVNQDHVFLHFGRYGTTCLNRKTFKQIWQRTDLPCNHHRGPASSPILHDGKLFVALDGYDQQYVVALDQKSGKTIWRKKREIEYGTNNGDAMKAYGTAAVFKFGDKTMLVYPSAVATIAYDPKSGDTIWKVYHGGMNASARPVLTKEGNLLITNGMGTMVAVNPRGKGNITSTNIAWSTRRSICKKSSPLVIGDRVYFVNDKGIAQCLDSKTGKRIWQERLGGNFSSSPVFDGEKIFMFGENGEAHVFKPADEFILLGHAKLAKGFKASPAIVGNKLLVRSFEYLFCFQGK